MSNFPQAAANEARGRYTTAASAAAFSAGAIWAFDRMRDEYDELLVALHGIGKALGIPESARSPYSVMCGTLECVNRLAEIERAEPADPRTPPPGCRP